LIEKDRDSVRDEWLREQGFKVLRFWNNEVLTNIDGVLEMIRKNCLSHPPLTPPVKGGEMKMVYPQNSLKNQKYRFKTNDQ
jgi:hypothetical protein